MFGWASWVSRVAVRELAEESRVIGRVVPSRGLVRYAWYAESPMQRMILAFLLVTVAGLADSPNNRLTHAEKLEGWQLLFDGSTPTGWEGFQGTAFPTQSWAIEDGALRTLADNSGGDIVSVGEFENFELSFDWKLVQGGNSGVKYLVQKAWAGPGYRPHLSPEAKRRSMLRATGPEYQLLDDENLNRRRQGWEYSSCGSLYLLYKPVDGKPVRPAGEWNTSRIVVRGTHGEHWLNGVKLLEYEFNSPDMFGRVERTKFKRVPGFGFKGPGHIALTHHNHPVWYRNIKIRTIEGPRVSDYLPGRLFDPAGLVPPPPRYPQPGDPTARQSAPTAGP